MALISAVAFEEGVSIAFLNPERVKTRLDQRVRRAIWRRLAAENDGERSRWAHADIARWFGVTRAAVTIAVRDNERKVKRASLKRSASVGVTPKSSLPESAA